MATWIGEVSKIDGRSHWVLAPKLDPDRAVGPMEADATLTLIPGSRVVISDVGDVGGQWVIVAALPAAT